ncbi:transcriptional regulator [Nocardia sp. NPDC055321]
MSNFRAASPIPGRILLTVTVLALLGLGGWQWRRVDLTAGIDHNLGYALLWPAFAGFLVAAYLRFGRPATDTADARRRTPESRELPMGLLPHRTTSAHSEDEDLAAYNAFLAALNDRELRVHLRAAGLER